MQERKRNWKKLFLFAFLFTISSGLVWFFAGEYIGNLDTRMKVVIENEGEVQPVESESLIQKTEKILSLFTRSEKIQQRKFPNKKYIEYIKYRGCVADGLLSGYGRDTDELVEMFNRSECKYLHRALETWLDPPDFDQAKKVMAEIKDPEMLFGMFIAEAIDTKAELFYPMENRNFDFDKMCREGSDNFWGEHTCKPSFSRGEYRKYLKFVTEKAIDLGVDVFMFGQIFYQDEKDLDDQLAGEIVNEIRSYASYRGVDVVIGAQTNDIDEEDYLRQFDFIEGGLGLKVDGSIENGPCFSRWWKKEGDWCWALLWNKRFRNKANNVLIHLDWSGVEGDDMSTFSRMSQEQRARVLKRLYPYFKEKEVGFLMPMLAVLPKENGGCHGASRKFYSADNEHTCADEDIINTILKGN